RRVDLLERRERIGVPAAAELRLRLREEGDDLGDSRILRLRNRESEGRRHERRRRQYAKQAPAHGSPRRNPTPSPLESRDAMAPERDTWQPDTYARFAAERRQPFFDLLGLVEPVPGGRAVDLGCGTGELTRELHVRTAVAETLGL